jgi:crossover junction endodeoxyribonuclease RuvC
MVKRLLNLPGLPGPDAADALGLAIMHAHAGRSLALLQTAGAPRSKSSAVFRGGRSG